MSLATEVDHLADLLIGAATVNTDGEPGTLCAIVVEPHTRVVTHVAVEPRHHHHCARLVPIELVAPEPCGNVRIDCDHDSFARLDELQHLEIIDLRGDAPYLSYASYASCGLSTAGGPLGARGPQYTSIWTDQVPRGERAVRRGTSVQVGDDEIGHLDGLLVGEGGHITAAIVTVGRLWWRRALAIPIEAITDVDSNGFSVAATWDQLPH